MILLVSNSLDNSTDSVSDWINLFFKKPSYRINGDDFLGKGNSMCIDLNKEVDYLVTTINDEKIDLTKVSTVWFRKDADLVFQHKVGSKRLSSQVNSHLNDEYKFAKKSAYQFLINNNEVLGERIINQPDKIEILLSAKKIGIDIPATLITNKKSDLLDFYSKYKSIITKPISEGKIYTKKKTHAAMYVSEVTEEDIEEVKDEFAVSMFQEKIQKEFDIRTFYLDGKCYSIAIFTNLDKKERIDVRDNIGNKTMRNVVYKLPEDIEQSISNLMKDLNLKTGSIDFVHTNTGRVVFLEVNPWGQYGFLSIFGNYNLDYQIAKYLVHGGE